MFLYLESGVDGGVDYGTGQQSDQQASHAFASWLQLETTISNSQLHTFLLLQSMPKVKNKNILWQPGGQTLIKRGEVGSEYLYLVLTINRTESVFLNSHENDLTAALHSYILLWRLKYRLPQSLIYIFLNHPPPLLQFVF